MGVEPQRVRAEMESDMDETQRQTVRARWHAARAAPAQYSLHARGHAGTPARQWSAAGGCHAVTDVRCAAAACVRALLARLSFCALSPQAIKYLRFAAIQRNVQIKDLETEINDFKESRIPDDDTYSSDDVRELIDSLQTSIRADTYRNLQRVAHSTVVLLRQCLQQAAQHGVTISVDTGLLQDEKFLLEAKRIEEESERTPEPTKQLAPTASGPSSCPPPSRAARAGACTHGMAQGGALGATAHCRMLGAALTRVGSPRRGRQVDEAARAGECKDG